MYIKFSVSDVHFLNRSQVEYNAFSHYICDVVTLITIKPQVCMSYPDGALTSPACGIAMSDDKRPGYFLPEQSWIIVHGQHFNLTFCTAFRS
jgi:predicted cupin superfamily sugar epimerase